MVESTPRSQAHLNVAMFLVSLTLRYVCIDMTYLHGQFLYLGSDVLSQFSRPDGFSSALPIGLLPSLWPPPQIIWWGLLRMCYLLFFLF